MHKRTSYRRKHTHTTGKTACFRQSPFYCCSYSKVSKEWWLPWVRWSECTAKRVLVKALPPNPKFLKLELSGIANLEQIYVCSNWYWTQSTWRRGEPEQLSPIIVTSVSWLPHARMNKQSCEQYWDGTIQYLHTCSTTYRTDALLFWALFLRNILIQSSSSTWLTLVHLLHKY